MRIVVISDSHGNAAAVQKIASLHTTAEVFICLGDGERDFEPLKGRFPDKLFRSVRGNSDWGSDSPLMDMLVLERKRILFAHGHTFNVKQSSNLILNEAHYVKANIVLYGHTHLPVTDYVGGVYVLNPGSVSQPRSGKPTYGVVDITDAGIVTRIVAV